MMPPSERKKRGIWTQEDLNCALDAIKNKGMSCRRAEKEFRVPRKTLERYLKSGSSTKAKLGRKFTLTEEQNQEVCDRIKRLSEIGYPITMKLLRMSVFKYCKENNITHQFSHAKQIASHKWGSKFLRANSQVPVSKSQNLNSTRAQKLNKAVVEDYFKKIKELYKKFDLSRYPDRLYNMDEKVIRFLHKEPKILAQKGAGRVDIVSHESKENVTVVACANATGVAIPPMILFKKKKRKQEFAEGLPPGAVFNMTINGSRTINSFLDWIHHFGQYKISGPCVLVFDGAKSYLDHHIVEEAAKYDVTLYCIPSNASNELRPLDKAVFPLLEYHCEEELRQQWHNSGDQSLSKFHFGRIFTPAWNKAATATNIQSGFQATGLYPLNPDAIPEVAYALSTACFRPNSEQELSRTETSSEVSQSTTTANFQAQEPSNPSAQ